jgi:hypothetical protein
MLYSAINNWIETKIAEFNQPLRNDELLRRSGLSIDLGMLPAGLKDKYYTIMLASARKSDIEANVFSVSAAIRFSFKLYRKPGEYYRNVIDEYIYKLSALLLDDEHDGLPYSLQGIELYNIQSFRLSGLDKTDAAGEYLLPSVEFDIQAVFT